MVMKLVVLGSRFLLGLIFIVFGLNGFFHFLPQPPMQPGLAKDYFVVMSTSGYLFLPFFLQLSSGILFLINRYIPFALVLIAPVIVNILLFHILMNPEGIVPGLVVTIFWCVLFYNVRSSFAGIFQPRRAG
jgi:putative oxidoreductase